MIVYWKEYINCVGSISHQSKFKELTKDLSKKIKDVQLEFPHQTVKYDYNEGK